MVSQLVQAGVDSGLSFEDAEYKAAIFLISQLHEAGVDMELAFNAILGKGSYARFSAAVEAVAA